MSHRPDEAAAGFDAQWLQLREPADHAARDPALAAAFAAALPRHAGTPLQLVDLAAGTGANCRVLAPLIGGDQDWLLIDHDPRLLAAQQDALAAWAAQQGWAATPIDSGLAHSGLEVRVTGPEGTARWRLRGQALDLARSLDALDLPRFDGVVTTAFLDLVSAAWLDRFSALLAQAQRPLLATLTVDGRRDWHPPLPADAALQAAFSRHQGGDKGFGQALGPQAAALLADRLAKAGLCVRTASSPWQLGDGQSTLLQRLVDEAAEVARQAQPGLASSAAAWQAERTAQRRQGSLRLVVGHVDLLACPTPQPR